MGTSTEWRYYSLPVPSGTSRVSILLGGFDSTTSEVLVRENALPDPTVYLRAYDGFSDWQPAAGTLYIAVHALQQFVGVPGSYSNLSLTAIVDSTPLPALSSITLTTYSVVGVFDLGMDGFLSNPAPFFFCARVINNHPYAHPSKELCFAAGGVRGHGDVLTVSPPNAPAAGTFSTVTGGVKVTSGVLTVNPDPNRSYQITLNPSTVRGGASTTGTVYLTRAAAPGGAVVPLRSLSPLAATPASITVPAGQMKASFPVTTKAVTKTTTLYLYGNYKRCSLRGVDTHSLTHGASDGGVRGAA